MPVAAPTFVQPGAKEINLAATNALAFSNANTDDNLMAAFRAAGQ